mmetsp:Transcript_32258/g.92863  ORF Transcript_32258/g.92863 Transcript_32258/m.92863 type:complete len:310 (-) Transcript_32258:382-1311(-)
MSEAVCYPVHVMLNGRYHVRQDGRAARPGDHEHVGEASDRQAQVGGGAIGPLLTERYAALASNVYAQERASEGIISSGKDNAVNLVLLASSPDAIRRDGLYACARVDQVDPGVVERFVVSVRHAQALPSDGVPRAQQVCGGLLLDCLSYPGADELRCGGVGFRVDCQVCKSCQEREAPVLPPARVLLPLLGARYLHGSRCPKAVRTRVMPVRRLLRLLAKCSVVCFDSRRLVGIEHAISRGNDEVCRALEDEELLCLVCNACDDLDTRRARTYDSHSLASKVCPIVRPCAGMIGRTLEQVHAFETGQVG